MSPKGYAVYNIDETQISIDYSRPLKRNRLIFGAKKDSALVPFGEYWRLGANKATSLNTNQPLLIGDKTLPAGKYRLYAVPYATYWDIVVHNQPEGSGAAVPDPTGDLFRLSKETQKMNESVDQFTIDFMPKDSLVWLRFMWDYTSVALPIHY